MEFPVPPQIDVCSAQGHLRYEQLYSASKIEPTSAMFRKNAAVGATLGAVDDAFDDKEKLLVVSAGCSFGAEIGTILAISRRNMPKRRLSVLGLDVNQVMLDEAATGVFNSYDSLDGLRKVYDDNDHDFDETMRSHGIRYDVATADDDQECVRLDTSGLLAKYPIEFDQVDLRQGLPAGKAAHLILCNNVLFHNSRENARLIVKGLVGGLAVGGVASFGVASITSRTLHRPGQEPVVIPDWWSGITDELATDGIVPFAPEDPSLRAYQRAA